MNQQSLTIEAPRAFLLLCGLAFLPSPFGPQPKRYARQALREIRLASVRNGFKDWQLLETLGLLPNGDIARPMALAARCLDAAGPYVVCRALSGPPGMSVLQPTPGSRGSELRVQMSVDEALAARAVH